jgi:hypothetical protein
VVGVVSLRQPYDVSYRTQTPISNLAKRGTPLASLGWSFVIDVVDWWLN